MMSPCLWGKLGLGVTVDVVGPKFLLSRGFLWEPCSSDRLHRQKSKLVASTGG